MSVDRHLAEIAREFPDWTIWRSDAGRWWATRRRPLTTMLRDVGCAMTVDADEADGLRELLYDQRRLALAGPAPSRDTDPEHEADLGQETDPSRETDPEHEPDLGQETGSGREGISEHEPDLGRGAGSNPADPAP